MSKANINDRQSIERVYPAEAYAADASENDRHKQEVVKGVRILSAPDAAGNFEFNAATQQVGESPGAVFLAPFHTATAEDQAPANPDSRHGYDGFIGDIIEAATKFGYRPEQSPGARDPRLRGPRQ